MFFLNKEYHLGITKEQLNKPDEKGTDSTGLLYIGGMIRVLLLLFFVALFMQGRTQKPVGIANKLSPALYKIMGDSLFKERLPISVSTTAPEWEQAGRFGLKKQMNGIYTGYVSRAEIVSLAAEKKVVFINVQHRPEEELNTAAVDYSLNKITKAHNTFPSIKGDSIFISVKERRFDTTDIDLKSRIVSSGAEASGETVHASVMATIVAGAGNSSPFALGVAPAAFISSANFDNLFPEPDLFYQQQKITVQNHSYGTTVENFYGNEAMAYDMSCKANPKLVQVFSAGNSGTVTPSSGIYANIAGIANLTGNFKQSKNTISVAALDSSGAPMTAASRGPAYDGRLKPELAAYGEDGSSGAAALVSGSVALLQDAYRKRNGVLPSSDLVKAVLLNSSADAGLPGIDYLTGYGSLNTYKAIQTIQQDRFFQSSVAQSQVLSFPMIIPPNTAQVKLTLAWNDAAAQANAAKALINDLDIVLRNVAAGEVWLPWVLNPAPVKDSLLLPAKRLRDTLNNVEQISIASPAAGSYVVEVKGSKVSQLSQDFTVSYAMDTAAIFSWDYPTASDPLVAGTASTLRWTSSFSGNGSLQYSFNGANWLPVAPVALTASQYKWTAPDTSANLLLRMIISSQNFLSDTIAVSPQLVVNVGFNCADSFQLNWKKLPVSSYIIHRLGSKYLEPLVTITDTSIVLSKQQNPSLYYAVAPVINRPALRSNTISYPGSGVGCYIVSFYLQSQTVSAAFFTAELGTLYRVKEVSLQKLTANNFVTIQTASSLAGTLFTFSDASLLKGENRYRLKLTLQNGQVIYSDAEVVYHFAETPVYVYPNPVRSSEVLKIISNESGRYTMRLLNSNGSEVYKQTILNSLTTIPAYRFPAGLYFVWVFDKEGKPFVQKVIIQ